MLINIAINLLWLCIGVIILGLVVYILLRVFKLWFVVPDRIEQAIWLIFVIICLIGLLTILGGGGLSAPHAGFLR